MAESWFEHLGRGGSTKSITVRNACESYIKHLNDSGPIKNAADIEARFKRWIYADTIAGHASIGFHYELTRFNRTLLIIYLNQFSRYNCESLKAAPD